MGKQIFSDFLVKTNKTGNYFKVAEFNFREDLRKDVDEDVVLSVFNCRTMSFDTYRINLIFYLLFSPFLSSWLLLFCCSSREQIVVVVDQIELKM